MRHVLWLIHARVVVVIRHDEGFPDDDGSSGCRRGGDAP
jgi:hypothetical protein